MPWLLLLAGIALLSLGASALVKGGTGLALRLGLTPLVIGLTVIAYGTSGPEVVVSVQAAVRGSPAIAIGNAVGSNLCNLALILGLCALIRPLGAGSEVTRREVPILIAGTVVVVLVLLDGRLQRWEGGALLAGLVVYTWVTIRQTRRKPEAADEGEYADKFGAAPPGLPLALGFTIGGLVLLVGGSDLFVRGAIEIARMFGLSDVVIGLTVVAIGTSLPELATSFVAAVKRSDVGVGNIVGSSLFNLLGILGLIGLLGESTTGGLTFADLAVLLVLTVGVLPLVRTGGRISRTEGALLLAAYIAYTTWMITRQG